MKSHTIASNGLAATSEASVRRTSGYKAYFPMVAERPDRKRRAYCAYSPTLREAGSGSGVVTTSLK